MSDTAVKTANSFAEYAAQLTSRMREYVDQHKERVDVQEGRSGLNETIVLTTAQRRLLVKFSNTQDFFLYDERRSSGETETPANPPKILSGAPLFQDDMEATVKQWLDFWGKA